MGSIKAAWDTAAAINDAQIKFQVATLIDALAEAKIQ